MDAGSAPTTRTPTPRQAPARCCAAPCADRDPAEVVGRAFTGAAVELALASYPGFTLTAPPGDGTPFGVFTAGVRAAGRGRRTSPSCPTARGSTSPPAGTHRRPGRRRPLEPPAAAATGCRRARPAGCRSARSPAPAAATRAATPTSASGRAPTTACALAGRDASPSSGSGELLPEAADLPVDRHALPNLRAVNFVVDGLLGEGVAAAPASTRRPRRSASGCAPGTLDIPEALL